MAIEYGYLHGYQMDRRTDDGQVRRDWVAIIVTAEGPEYRDSGQSLLAVMNSLGEHGWIIGDAISEPVVNNDIKDTTLWGILVGQGVEIIRCQQRRFMQRNIGWPDGSQD